MPLRQQVLALEHWTNLLLLLLEQRTMRNALVQDLDHPPQLQRSNRMTKLGTLRAMGDRNHVGLPPGVKGRERPGNERKRKNGSAQKQQGDGRGEQSGEGRMVSAEIKEGTPWKLSNS